MNTSLVIIIRDIRHVFKQKLRIVTTLIRPLLWLFVIGVGIKSFTPQIQGYSYQEFIIPGLFGMMLLFSGLLSALSLLKEKYSGFLRLLLVAPITKSALLTSKLCSATIVSLIFLFIFLGICYVLNLLINPFNLLLFFGVSLLIALLWASVGLFLAILTPNLENFSVLMNLIVFPIFFLSNALYPVFNLPKALYLIISINPLTYCVDAFYQILGMHNLARFDLWINLIVIGLWFILIFSAALYKFNKDQLDVV